MALNPVWPSDKQFKEHKAPPLTEAILKSRTLATNNWGRPEGVFYYRKDDVTEMEYCCDLDMRKNVTKDGREELLVTTVIFICPRCQQSCCVHGSGSVDGDARQIEVHWDKAIQSKEDGLWRPTFTISGVLVCDYFWHEISGGLAVPGVSNACGWRGKIEMGRGYDVERPTIRVVSG